MYSTCTVSWACRQTSGLLDLTLCEDCLHDLSKLLLWQCKPSPSHLTVSLLERHYCGRQWPECLVTAHIEARSVIHFYFVMIVWQYLDIKCASGGYLNLLRLHQACTAFWKAIFIMSLAQVELAQLQRHIESQFALRVSPRLAVSGHSTMMI